MTQCCICGRGSIHMDGLERLLKDKCLNLILFYFGFGLCLRLHALKPLSKVGLMG